MSILTSRRSGTGDATTVDMANAAHEIVLPGTTAGSAQTELLGEDLFVDPNGGSVTLTIPAATALSGRFFFANTADAAETITIDDGGGTVATIAQNESVVLVSDGSAWYPVVGTNT